MKVNNHSGCVTLTLINGFSVQGQAVAWRRGNVIHFKVGDLEFTGNWATFVGRLACASMSSSAACPEPRDTLEGDE